MDAPRNGNVLQLKVEQLEDAVLDASTGLRKRVEDMEKAHAVMAKTLEMMERTAKDVSGKIDTLNAWVRGLVGSVIVALILLVIDLIRGKH